MRDEREPLGGGCFPSGFAVSPSPDLQDMLARSSLPTSRNNPSLAFNEAAVEKKAFLEELASLTHFPEDRQNVQKSFVFLLNLVVQTWKVNKKLAINNMKSFLTRKESRAALIN